MKINHLDIPTQVLDIRIKDKFIKNGEKINKPKTKTN